MLNYRIGISSQMAILAAICLSLSIWVIDYSPESIFSPEFLIQNDALLYRLLAAEWADNPFQPFLETLNDGTFRFNWVGLPVFGSLIYGVFGGLFDQIVIILNVILLGWTFSNLRYILKEFGDESRFGALIISMMCMPIFVVYTNGLSKEIPSLWILSQFIVLIYRKRYLWYLLVVLIAFFIRQQYAAVGVVFFVIYVVRIRPAYIILGVAAILPLIPLRFFGFSDWIISHDEVRTGALMAGLAESFDFPGGFLLLLPIRLFVNFLQPIWPPNIIEVVSAGFSRPVPLAAILYHLSGLTAALLIMFAAFQKFFRKGQIPDIISSLIWAFCITMGTLIYLHPRLFLPIIPFVALSILCSISRQKEEESDLLAARTS